MKYLFSRPYLLLALIFVISRFVYIYWFDVQFNASPLKYGQQYLDSYLLQSDLIRSIFYLHQQPPLLNLYLGIVYKFFPVNYSHVFHIVQLCLGLLFSLSLFGLMTALSVRLGIALVIVSLFIISPTMVMYEHWLQYAYFAACMLCFSALFLIRFLQIGRKRDGAIFFSLYACLVLTRGLYRPELFVLVIIILWFCCKDKRKAILQTAAIPLLVVALFCAKQYVLFDTISFGSSYVGRNFAIRTSAEIPKKMRKELLDNKVVSKLFFEDPKKVMRNYKPFLPPIEKTGVPALDQQRKPTAGGSTNFNYIGTLPLSDALLKDFKSLLLVHPEYYLKSFWRIKYYFYPSGTKHWGLQKYNYKGSFKKLSQYYNMVFVGKFPGSPYGWWLVIGFPILLIFGLVRTICLYRSERSNVSQWLIMAFIVLHITYLTVLTIGVSYGHYHRYRFDFNSFYVVLFALLCNNLFNRVAKSNAIMSMVSMKKLNTEESSSD